MPKAIQVQREPKFYEMDGALRAYSNRSLALAGLMGLTALLSVMWFFFFKMKPTTVIRVNNEGDAQVVSPRGAGARRGILPAVPHPRKAQNRTSMKNEAFIRQFLGHYLSTIPTRSVRLGGCDEHDDEQPASRGRIPIAEDNTVGKLEDEQAMSTASSAASNQRKRLPDLRGLRGPHGPPHEQRARDQRQLVEQYRCGWFPWDDLPKTPMVC